MYVCVIKISGKVDKPNTYDVFSSEFCSLFKEEHL